MADNGKILSLTALQEEIAGVVELYGVRHNVRAISSGQQQRIVRFQKNPDAEGYLDLAMEICCEVLDPPLPREAVEKWSAKARDAVVALASRGIEAVEEAFPNAVSPEPSTSPGSPQPTS